MSETLLADVPVPTQIPVPAAARAPDLAELKRRVAAPLPRHREGLELLDDFDAMGQRLSASGTTGLSNVRVEAADIVPHPTGGLAVVLRAAERIDAAWTSGLDQKAVVHASIDVAPAQYLASGSALKAVELLFQVGGASTTACRHNLDRHWRNARTVSKHNPRHWKAAVVGARQLKNAPPPASGLF